MIEPAITDEMLVAEVLQQIPEAAELFRQHGVDPVKHCGPQTRIVHLAETPNACRLRDLDGLLLGLNAALQAARFEDK